MKKKHSWLLIAVVSILTPPAGAGDVQVNTYTTSRQARPAVATSPTGEFVVVWTSLGSSGTDSSLYSIQGQRYSAQGKKVGGQFQVNTYTTNHQTTPSVAQAGSGAFVVAWDGYGALSTDFDIHARRYAADGSPLGEEFPVNAYTTELQLSPVVAAGTDGDFIVVWESNGSAGTDSLGLSVQGRRFASDGSPVGDGFQINTYTTSTQHLPSVAMDAGGNFIAVWDSFGSSGTDADLSSVQGQRFASGGSPMGEEFQVNSYTHRSSATRRWRWPAAASSS
ncbi:MAG: hypothetical protein GY719_22790 [bacterium]|nr:hypothetical protein [bacterium]